MSNHKYEAKAELDYVNNRQVFTAENGRILSRLK
jgi:hypothetical protein